MSTTLLPYGPKLTREGYEAQIIALHTTESKPASTKSVRAKELNLSIDYKLGLDFPASRREQLVQHQAKLDRYFELNLFKGLLRSPLDPLAGPVRACVRAFGNVLSPDELATLLDLDSAKVMELLH